MSDWALNIVRVNAASLEKCEGQRAQPRIDKTKHGMLTLQR